MPKRSGIDTTLRLGRPSSPTSPRFSINTADFRGGSNTHAYRPFSLGGSGTGGIQSDRPLAGAFRIYTPPTWAAPTLHTAVDKAPDPGTSHGLTLPKAGMKPREKQTIRLWSKLDSNHELVEASTSGPSASGSVVQEAAPMVEENLKISKQPTEHVKPSLTPWSYYHSNYFKQSPPKIFYRNIFMPQASSRFQARIEALQAAKTWLMTQSSSHQLSRAESALLAIPFRDWRSIGIRIDTARRGLAPKAMKDLIRQAKQDRLSILGLEDLLQKIASKAVPMPR
ncbi:hypothetical protein PHBOTO_004299 [Pseudozyma hubeiensis]|nr:hypothetical protein PHBOTO_004299 [Pseudozyma hubeiensis]